RKSSFGPGRGEGAAENTRCNDEAACKPLTVRHALLRHSGMVRKDQTRNLEILRCAIAHHSSHFVRPGMTPYKSGRQRLHLRIKIRLPFKADPGQIRHGDV